jgi:hypothetical protein
MMQQQNTQQQLHILSKKRLLASNLCWDLGKLFGRNCPDELKWLIGTYSSVYQLNEYVYDRKRVVSITDFEYMFNYKSTKWVENARTKAYQSYDSLDSDMEPNSFMKTKWTTNATLIQIFTSERMQKVNQLCDRVGKSRFDCNDIYDLIDLVQWFNKLLKLGKPRNYVKSGSNSKTCNAVWNNKTSKERKLLHPSLHSSNAYRNAINLAGVFKGRLNNMLTHVMTQECAMMDKHGLFKLDSSIEYDVPTLVWCLFFLGDLNVRNEFTLESQMHGGLNPFLSIFLNKYLSHREETNWELISLLYPTANTLDYVSTEVKQQMLDAWMRRLNGMKLFLKLQWKAGVCNCKGDQIHTPWTVPRRGSGVDSNGWNAVAGSWNNALRHIKILSSQLDQSYPLLFTCPKLTAGDQAQWAHAKRMKVDPKIEVLTEIIQGGIFPWSSLDGEDQTKILHCIVTTADLHEVPLERFLRLPAERAVEFRVQYDMICGVCVHGITADVADAAIAVGFAGSNPHMNAI